MKKINFLRFAKILCWIAFVIFYLLSVETSGILHSADRNLILYGVFLTLTIITVLVITAIYAKSKKFFITISAYFSLWFVATASVTQMGYYLPDVIIVVFAIIYYSFYAPFMGLERYIWIDKGSTIFDDTDYAVYTLFVFVIVLVYAVYFISRKLQTNKIKRDISEKLQNLAYENFNKAIASWKEECPEEVEGIPDNEFNADNLSLNSINNKKGFIYSVEAKYSKTFSNGIKVIYILKFCDDFEVFDDVLYTENIGD